MGSIVQQQQRLTLKYAGSEKKRSSPPPRYTEPKLVQTMEKLGIGRPSSYAITCQVLRERRYTSLVKGHLQPTKLGMEVDEFLMRVLPKMVEPEFTAEMESALDDVAAGKQQWEKYLTNWNQTYFAPALEAAYQSLGTRPRADSGGGKAARASTSSGVSKQAALTEIHCPKCEWLMQKIPCHSEKMQADHFLKCSNSGCGAAMFWSDKKQGYELPYSERKESSQKGNGMNPDVRTSMPQSQTHGKTSASKSPSTKSNRTDHACPVCGKPLELYEYTKENQRHQMLRCSDSGARRQDDHKAVTFFAAKGGFWSPTYGEIGKHSSSKSAKVSTDEAVTPPSASQPTTEHPCPVCSKPMELYEYIKENQQKQMLRCSDIQARRRDDHKDAVYFASKGVFWSPKYGEVGSASKMSLTKTSSKTSNSRAKSKFS